MNTHKAFYIIAFTIVISFFSVMQSRAQYNLIKLGYAKMNNKDWGEVLIGKSLTGNEALVDLDNPSFVSGISLGMEWNNQDISPKASFGGIWKNILVTSLNVNYFPKNESSKFAFTPEVGLSLSKVLNVTYGYQFRGKSNQESDLNNNPHRFSISFVMPFF
ncbi:hypothetical protein BKI52_01985 [marine bacterium AO1-C]|nr:hypothetical protein BKI52_01985 [marine bacterium AO1-C]